MCASFGEDRLRDFGVARVEFCPLRLASSPLKHSRTTVRVCDYPVFHCWFTRARPLSFFSLYHNWYHYANCWNWLTSSPYAKLWSLLDGADCVVEDCQVDEILFRMGFNGAWWFTAYVILKSADDVAKAVAHSGSQWLTFVKPWLTVEGKISLLLYPLFWWQK